MEKDHKFFHQTTFVKINQFIKMKKIAYCLLIGLSFTLLCSCFSDKDELYFMRDIDMFIRLYQKAGTDTAYIFFDNKEDVDSSNLIKISPIYELPSAKIIINKTDSIIYFKELYSHLAGYKTTNFKVITLVPTNTADSVVNKSKNMLNEDSILSKLNNEKKEYTIFKVGPYANYIEKWYSTPGWHVMPEYSKYVFQ